MKLRISGIHAAGDFARERIILEALEDVDVGSYAVLVAYAHSTKKRPLGGTVPSCFWIPDKAVKKGDLVVIYTKSGNSAQKVTESGSTSYFFYWELDHAVWLDDKTVVLVEIALGWTFLPVEKAEVTDESGAPTTRR